MRSTDIRLEDDWQQDIDCCYYLDDQVHVVSFIGEEERRRQEILDQLTNQDDQLEEQPEDDLQADSLDPMESTLRAWTASFAVFFKRWRTTVVGIETVAFVDGYLDKCYLVGLYLDISSFDSGSSSKGIRARPHAVNRDKGRLLTTHIWS